MSQHIATRWSSRIQIDRGSPIPPFEQLRAQLALLIASGRLGPSTRLPTIRDLAHDLDLASGTVARAYRELEYGGLVTGKGRRGTFVTDEPPYGTSERKRRLDELAEAFSAGASHLGFDRGEAVAAVDQAMRALPPEE